MRFDHLRLTVAALVAVGLLSACASEPPPRPQPAPRPYQPPPPPAPSPAAEVPVGARTYLVIRTAKLRAAPYLGSDTVLLLEEGNTYDLIVTPADQLNWSEVVVAGTGERGFLSGDVLVPAG